MTGRSAVAERSDALTPRAAGRTGLVIDQIIATHGLLSIPIGHLVANPRNVREDLGDLRDLTTTIREVGILVPLIVCTVEAYAASGGPAILTPGVTHVVLDGTRRTAASGPAGLTELPAIVRNDLVGATDFELQVISSLHRKGLAPLEEATAIAQMPGGQVAVAARIGCHQSQVSRRLKLLRLPDVIKDALRAQTITATDADHLSYFLDAPDALLRAYALMTRTDDVQLNAKSAVDTVKQDIQRESNAEASRAAIAAAGLSEITPDTLWGSRAKIHLIAHGDLSRTLSRTHKACLAASVSEDDGLVDWYCADLSRHGVLDDVAEARRARTRRRSAVTELAADWQGVTAAAYEIADAVIADARPGSVLRLALQLAADQGIVPPELPEQEPEAAIVWIQTRLAGDSRVRVARLLHTIAAGEVATRKIDEWGPRQRTFLALLKDRVSYSTDPWEASRLDRQTEAEVLGTPGGPR